MTQDAPYGRDLVLNETPSKAAVMEIQLGPDRSARARGSVPPEHSPQLIMTFGIAGCAVAGITGMAVTLRIATSLTGPAYAELALALACAVMIWLHGTVAHAARRQGTSESDPPGGPPEEL
jgi:hypothetical protein